MRHAAILLLVASVATLLGGCVGGPTDKCYLFDVEYREARRAFERTQSLELVRQGLIDAHWPNCKVNEAIYRIEKEFGLNDELPSPRRIRTPQELLIEEQQDQQLVGGRADFSFR